MTIYRHKKLLSVYGVSLKLTSSESVTALSAFLNETFSVEPPPLNELLRRNSELEKLGQLPSDVVNSSLPKDSATTLDSAIRYLLIPSGDEVDQLRSEKRALATNNAKLQREFEESLSSERVRYAALQDKFHETLGRWKVVESAKTGLEEQLERANQEYAAVVRDLKKTKEKMAKRRDQYNATLTENHTLRAALNQKTTELRQANLKLEQEAEKKRRRKEKPLTVSKDEMRLHIENGTLATMIKELTERVQSLQTERQQIQDEKDQDGMRYESRIQTLERDVARQRQENDEITSKLKEQRKQIDEVQSEKAKSDKKLAEMTSVLVAIQNQMEDTPPLVILPERVAKLIDQGPLHAEIRRLKALVNGYATFVTQLLENGRSDLSLLDGVEKLPNWMNRALEDKIGECRKFVYETGVTETIPLFDAALGLPQSTTILLKQLQKSDEIVSVLSTFTAVAAKLVTRIRDDNEKAEKIATILHLCDVPREKRISQILKYLQENGKVIDGLLAFLVDKSDDPVTAANVFPALMTYATNAAQISTGMEEHLREFVNGSCPAVEMPKKVRDYIRNIAKTLSDMEAQLKTAKRIEKELKEAQTRLSRMTEKLKEAEERKKDLTSKVEEKDEQILTMTGQLEQEIEKKLETERNLEDVQAEKQRIETECQLLRSERDRLKQAISDKGETFEKCLEEALESEKRRHGDEVRRLTERSATQQELVMSKLKDKSRKLTEARKMITDLEQCLKDSHEKYEAAYKSLQQQSKQLKKQCQKKAADLSPQDRALLKTATDQRREMMSKISELSNSVSGLGITVEEDFVSELGEILESCFRSSGEWTEKRVKKAVQILIDRLHALESSHNSV